MIVHLFLCVAFVYSVWYTLQPGEIFSGLGDWFNKNLPERLHNPAYDCPKCMQPYYGSLFYWLFIHPFWLRTYERSQALVEWAVIVLCSVGVSAIIGELSPVKPDRYAKEVDEEKELTPAQEIELDHLLQEARGREERARVWRSINEMQKDELDALNSRAVQTGFGVTENGLSFTAKPFSKIIESVIMDEPITNVNEQLPTMLPTNKEESYILKAFGAYALQKYQSEMPTYIPEDL